MVGRDEGDAGRRGRVAIDRTVTHEQGALGSGAEATQRLAHRARVGLGGTDVGRCDHHLEQRVEANESEQLAHFGLAHHRRVGDRAQPVVPCELGERLDDHGKCACLE